MECNRDEAIRAKTIAERKLTEKDFDGAKKFALKAQSLYPGLEGISQMLTTLHVYVSAENKVSGEVDWYGILGVNPSADDETVKKQYRKLALILHPDKNKSVGADGAFKLLSEAWNLLSDKAKRLAYSQRRSSTGFQQTVPNKSGPSAPPRANGFHNFTNRATSNSKTHNNTSRVPANSVPPPSYKTHSNTFRVPPTSVPPPSYQRSDTFWTICHRCKMHYQYLKKYLNHTLLCPNCQESFLASDMAPPSNFSKSSNYSSHQRNQNSSKHASSGNPFDPGRSAAAAQNLGQGGSAGVNSLNHTNIQKGPFSRTASVGSTEPSIAAKAAHVVQQANERMKRGHEESQAAAGWDRCHVSSSILRGDVHFKKRRGLDNDGNSYGGNMAYQMASGNGGMGSVSGVGKGGFETDRVYGFSSIHSKPSTGELTPLEMRNILIKKAQMEIRKKLKEWSSETASKAAVKEKVKESKKEKEKSTVKVQTQDVNRNGESFATKRADRAQKCFTSTSADDRGKEVPAPSSMNVPDPDFHDFDLDRTESSFGDNQVWAAYDDDDGMPRFYAMIHKVVTRKPFKMKISWLNSKTNSEFGPVEWVSSGFFKTCGEFWIGKHEMYKSLNAFSHKVNWRKGPRGSIHIFPKKGDVWALYRNWSPDWNKHTPDEVIHKYDMVEVLDEYNEEQGVSVTPLIKVAGFRTVFHADLGPDKVIKIPKEEMFRFSHQVPNYLLTGQEAQNAPKGCQELDPAATLLELLVITEANEVPIVQNGGKVEEESLQSAPENTVDKMFDGAAKATAEEMVVKGEETKKADTIG